MTLAGDPTANRTLRRQVVALTALLVAMSRPALAADSKILVLETRVGQSQPGSPALLGGFIDGWGEGAVSGGQVARAVEKQISRSAGVGGGLLSKIKSALAQIEQEKYLRTGQWRQIIEILEPLREQFGDYVGSIATDPRTRDEALGALVSLARAYQGSRERSGRALNLVVEIIRSFPDKTISDETRGPAFFQLYSNAVAAEKKQPKFKLTIEAQASNCSVYLNEYRVGATPRAERVVPAGRYRVFVDCGNRQSRVLDVNVAGDSLHSIDLGFDSAVDLTDDRAALVFGDERASSAHLIPYASRIGRAVHTTLGTDRAVTIGLVKDPRSGLPTLVGVVIDPDSELQITAHSITLDSAGPKSLMNEARELGEVLRRKNAAQSAAPMVATATTPPQTKRPPDGARPENQPPASPGVSPIPPAAGTVEPTSTVSRAPSSGRHALPAYPGYIALGLGAGMLAAGGGLAYLDGRGTCSESRCPFTYDTGTGGVTLLVAGGALLVAGAGWAIGTSLTKRRNSEEPSSTTREDPSREIAERVAIQNARRALFDGQYTTALAQARKATSLNESSAAGWQMVASAACHLGDEQTAQAQAAWPHLSLEEKQRMRPICRASNVEIPLANEEQQEFHRAMEDATKEYAAGRYGSAWFSAMRAARFSRSPAATQLVAEASCGTRNRTTALEMWTGLEEADRVSVKNECAKHGLFFTSQAGTWQIVAHLPSRTKAGAERLVHIAEDLCSVDKDYKQALATAREALTVAPEDEAAWFVVGVSSCQLRDRQAAAEAARHIKDPKKQSDMGALCRDVTLPSER